MENCVNFVLAVASVLIPVFDHGWLKNGQIHCKTLSSPYIPQYYYFALLIQKLKLLCLWIAWQPFRRITTISFTIAFSTAVPKHSFCLSWLSSVCLISLYLACSAHHYENAFMYTYMFIVRVSMYSVCVRSTRS